MSRGGSRRGDGAEDGRGTFSNRRAWKREAAYGFLVSARRRTGFRAGHERFQRAKRGARGDTYPWSRACGPSLAAGACVRGERVGGVAGRQRGSQKSRHLGGGVAIAFGAGKHTTGGSRTA